MPTSPKQRSIWLGWVLAAAMSPLAAGCSARHTVAYEVRRHPTGLAAGDGVVILLHQYQNCSESGGNGCEARSHRRWKEKKFEGCMEWAMQGVKPDLRIVAAARFRQAAFQGLEYRDEPRAPEALLQFLSAPGVRERIAPLGVRYLVVVDASTRKFNSRGNLEVDSDSPMWGIGSEWQRHSQVNAVVLDLGRGREAGTLNAGSNGQGGVLLPFLIILPMPPVGWSSPTEGRACKALGRAAARFIAGPGGEGGE